MTTISVHNLTKRYGAFEALSHLDLEIEAGSVCGLLGPNGAGKTTAFKCMLGLARPDSGGVTIEGAPLTAKTFETVAYVPERNVLHCWMTVGQHVELNRRANPRHDPKRAAELLALFKLDSVKRVQRLSKGQQTALMLALALASRPRVLILDEPSSGLDPIFQRAVLDLIIDAAAGGASILFSSHQIGQVERAADRVAILKDGRLVLEGSVDTLKGSQKIVEAVFEDAVPSLNGFGQDARIVRTERLGRVFRAYVRDGSEEIARRLDGLGSKSVAVIDQNLEDIFLNAVADGTQTKETA